jgi:hypothetical protein
MFCRSPSLQGWILAVLAALLLSACGGGSGGTPPPVITPPPAPSNIVSLVVDAGPTGNEVNRAFASVKLCQPGSSTLCTTIDHVVIDTGSVGLRLLANAVPATLALPRQTVSAGTPLLNCVQFVDQTYAFGPVVTADLVLGGKTAASTPVQLIADPAYSRLGSACASGSAINTLADLGANGILGLGLAREDCGSACATRTGNGSYFTCTDNACTAVKGVAVATAQQIKHPVPLFASDNNGLLLDFPAVPDAGLASVNGSLIFGIGTQSNNQLGAGSTLGTNGLGYITTVYNGQNLRTSYIDSGSNGLYFPSGIALCTNAGFTDFYCPTGLTPGSATLSGANGTSTEVSFAIDNTVNLFSGAAKAAVPTLAGPTGDSTTFDWGLPFFFGRRVFVGIEGMGSNLGTGPYFAF